MSISPSIAVVQKDAGVAEMCKDGPISLWGTIPTSYTAVPWAFYACWHQRLLPYAGTKMCAEVKGDGLVRVICSLGLSMEEIPSREFILVAKQERVVSLDGEVFLGRGRLRVSTHYADKALTALVNVNTDGVILFDGCGNVVECADIDIE